jgi:hypothetical protein
LRQDITEDSFHVERITATAALPSFQGKQSMDAKVHALSSPEMFKKVDARARRVGFWKDPKPVPPWIFGRARRQK